MVEISDKQLDELLEDVTAQSTQLDGIASLIGSLRDKVKDELTQANASAGAKARIDAIFAKLGENSQKIATALSAGTDVNTGAAAGSGDLANGPGNPVSGGPVDGLSPSISGLAARIDPSPTGAAQVTPLDQTTLNRDSNATSPSVPGSTIQTMSQGAPTASGRTTDSTPSPNSIAKGPDPLQSQYDQGTPLAPGSTGRQPVDPLDPVDPDSGHGQNTGLK